METIVAGFYSVALPDSRTQSIKHITFVLTPHGTRCMPNLHSRTRGFALSPHGTRCLPGLAWHEVITRTIANTPVLGDKTHRQMQVGGSVGRVEGSRAQALFF